MAAFLDLADPAFDVTSAAVHQAREQDWYAVTPYGWAVLRHAEGTAVLKDKRLQPGATPGGPPRTACLTARSPSGGERHC